MLGVCVPSTVHLPEFMLQLRARLGPERGGVHSSMSTHAPDALRKYPVPQGCCAATGMRQSRRQSGRR
eukprot:1968461-Rhodomonas_salina.1